MVVHGSHHLRLFVLLVIALSVDSLDQRHTRKSVDGSNKSYHERKTLRRPIPTVKKGFEDFGSILMWAQDRQRKKNGKKARNVDYENRSFELGQEPSDDGVHDYSKQHRRPKQ